MKHSISRYIQTDVIAVLTGETPVIAGPENDK